MIFKRGQVNLVATGRALSDRGYHDDAITALKKASEMEPANVEALANLALALERASLIQESVAVGEGARQLAPDHYWVNLGLARTLFLLSRWTESANRARHAAAHAPGVAERASALNLGARSALGGGNHSMGCELLRQAAGLQATREMQDEIARSRCASP